MSETEKRLRPDAVESGLQYYNTNSEVTDSEASLKRQLHAAASSSSSSSKSNIWFMGRACVLECEGRVSPSLTWEVCKRAVKLSQHALLSEESAWLQRAGEELTPLDLNVDGEVLQSAATKRFPEEDGGETASEQRSIQSDSSLQESSEEGGSLQGLRPAGGGREQRDSENDVQLEGERYDSPEAVSLFKRFGGFQRGRHSYRKLIGPPRRPLQKRYGGFIGVRKSARKWNSQKRVNQLLRQYLGMRSSRSGRFNNNVPVTRVWRQDKL